MTTKLYMPVIAPPPPPQAAATYYANIAAQTTVTATSAARSGLTISVSNTNFRTLYAMESGLLSFIPVGSPLVNGSAETATVPSLVLQIAPHAAPQIKNTRKLPSLEHVLYLGVDAATIRPALEPLLPDVKNLPLGELQKVWAMGNPSSTGDLNLLAPFYLDQVAAGKVALLVPPGAAIGMMTGTSVTLRMLSPQKADLSPVFYIRNMPAYGEGVEAAWTGHPLIGAVTNVTLPIDIYVRFEVWDLNAKAYVPLPAGIPIALMDYDPVSGNDQLGLQNTDAQGRVAFHYANLQALAALDPDDTDRPDLFFMARTAGRSYAGHTLPTEWSTKGWRAVNGTPGYFENFDGTTLIGKEDAPLVFRVGVDIHLALKYEHHLTALPAGVPAGTRTLPATSGIPIDIRRQVGVSVGRPTTDQDGQVHAVFFNISPGDLLHFAVSFEIADPSIKLPRAMVNRSNGGGLGDWVTLVDDADRTTSTSRESLDTTSFGSQAKPAELICTIEERNVALYLLKVLREWSTFLFHMTGGAWTGISNLIIYTSTLGGTSYSWPIGDVNIDEDDHWDRGTIAHELSHQIMWKECAFGNLTIPFNAKLLHRTTMIHTEEHALIEGWAELIEEIFAARSNPPFNFSAYSLQQPLFLSTLLDRFASAGPLITSPLNGQGARVEGAFANSLYRIFDKYVARAAATPPGTGFPLIPETVTGDVSTTAPWIKDATARARFLSLIWNPLKDLAAESSANKRTGVMITKIQTRNSALWPSLLAEFRADNVLP